MAEVNRKRKEHFLYISNDSMFSSRHLTMKPVVGGRVCKGPKVLGSNLGPGGEEWWLNAKSLVDAGYMRAFSLLGSLAQNGSCTRDWGSSWILLHRPAAVALAGPTDEQSSF